MSYYHNPPKPVSTRVRCPVCHEDVYSRAGIHPQCAVRQSDPPRPKNKQKGVPVEVVPGPEAVEPVGVIALGSLPPVDGACPSDPIPV